MLAYKKWPHTLINIFIEPQICRTEGSEEGLERFSRLWEEIWEDKKWAEVWRVSVGLWGNSMEFEKL